MPRVRVLMNEYVGDILHYFTAFHGQIISSYVTNELNARYSAFTERYPAFNGPISLLGFSLGGLITYDILCSQRPGHSLQDAHVQPPLLNFKPNMLFTLGSPVSATLVMRGQCISTYCLPDWCKMQNIYHPCDPLGYRLEPLVHPDLEHVPAVSIPSHKSHPTYLRTQLIQQSKAPLWSDVLRIPSVLLGRTVPMYVGATIYRHFNGVVGRVVNYFKPPPVPKIDPVDWMQDLPDTHYDHEEWDDKSALKHLVDRLDYMVVDDRMSYMNEYLVGIRAHFIYWNNRDVVQHILTCLHDDYL